MFGDIYPTEYMVKTTYTCEAEILTPTKYTYCMHFKPKLLLQVEKSTWSSW